MRRVWKFYIRIRPLLSHLDSFMLLHILSAGWPVIFGNRCVNGFEHKIVSVDFSRSLVHNIPFILLYEVLTIKRILDLHHLKRWSFVGQKGTSSL